MQHPTLVLVWGDRPGMAPPAAGAGVEGSRGLQPSPAAAGAAAGRTARAALVRLLPSDDGRGRRPRRLQRAKSDGREAAAACSRQSGIRTSGVAAWP